MERTDRMLSCAEIVAGKAANAKDDRDAPILASAARTLAEAAHFVAQSEAEIAKHQPLEKQPERR